MQRLIWAQIGALICLLWTFSKAKAFELDLYLGAEPGYSMLSPNDTSVESKKSGYHMGVKVIPSLYFDKAVVDGTVGWFRNSMEGTPKANPIDTPQDVTTVTTQAGFSELSARWRMTPSWELGPIAMMTFGTETDFSPISSLGKTTNGFVGLQLLNAHRGRDAEEPTSGMAFRWGLSALRSITIKKRAVTLVNLNLHLGFTAAPLPSSSTKDVPPSTGPEAPPGDGEDPPPQESTAPAQASPTDSMEAGVKDPVAYAPPPPPKPPIDVAPLPQDPSPPVPPPPVAAPEPQAMGAGSIPGSPALAGVVYFPLGSFRLSSSEQQQLTLLAEALMRDLSSWESITVSGHTDTTGTVAVNKRVSLKRAQAVRSFLIKAGVPGDRIIAEGLGTEKILTKSSNGLSHARNRRAEIRVHKINQASLVSAFDSVRLLSALPSTCHGRVCR